MIALDLCQAHYQILLIIYQLIFRRFGCKKSYKKNFNKELIKRFANISEFCDRDINKFILLLRKGVHPYEYMDNWERFDETLIIGMQKEYLKTLIIKI